MIRVTDHALVRFLDRVGGLDLETVRAQISASLQRAHDATAAIGAADYTVKVDGVIYVVRNGVLVTIVGRAPLMADDLENIPVSLQDIADTLGLRIVVKLIEHFGGVELKFPKRPADDHPVCIALGTEDGKALCDFLSGSLIYVPHMKARRNIRADVLALEEAGRKRREIARILGVSQRHVRRMANGAVDGNQFDLFAED